MSPSNSLKELAPDAVDRIPTPATRWFSRFALPLGIVGIAVPADRPLLVHTERGMAQPNDRVILMAS